jgi:hypothetical protein
VTAILIISSFSPQPSSRMSYFMNQIISSLHHSPFLYTQRDGISWWRTLFHPFCSKYIR